MLFVEALSYLFSLNCPSTGHLRSLTLVYVNYWTFFIDNSVNSGKIMYEKHTQIDLFDSEASFRILT